MLVEISGQPARAEENKVDGYRMGEGLGGVGFGVDGECFRVRICLCIVVRLGF